MKLLPTSVAVALSLQLCSLGLTLALSDTTSNDDASSVNFLAIGDWGGVGSSLMMGLVPLERWGKIQQTAVAVGLAKVAKDIHAEFTMGLGDNFYFKGVGGERPFDRIEQTFERVYSDPALQIPFYTCAGNHDHYGNVTEQLEYTKHSKEKARTNSSFVHRWEFPELYHKQTIRRGNLTIDLVFIDTVTLEQSHEGHGLGKWIRGYSKLRFLDGSRHWRWLETQLQGSRADYVLVAGHYPVFNQGSHGADQTLIDHLKPLLDKHQAHYLAGHDHSMSHFVTNSSTSTGSTNYIVTGAGNSCCSFRRSKAKKKHETEHPGVPIKWHMYHQDNTEGVKGGFVSMRATLGNLRVRYHDQDGKVLFEAAPILPRKLGVWEDATSVGDVVDIE